MGNPNRRGRRNAKVREPKRLIDKPGTSEEGDKAEEANDPSASLVGDSFSLPTATRSQAHGSDPHNAREYGKYVLWPVITLWRGTKGIIAFLDRHHGGVTALATIAIGILTFFYVGYSKKQWQTMQDTLRVSQRAYITIGRKDGVVADFVVPKDPKANAEIIIYFQNSGHLPAKLVWGTSAPFLAAGGTKKSTGITYTHNSIGFLSPRTRDIKTGSIGEQGESVAIAGDSVYVSTLGVISQKDLGELPTHNMGLLILGQFDYCDEIGTRATRSFGLRYRSNAPTSNLSFDLAVDTAFPTLPLPKSTTTTEYLPPCETTAERDQNQKK